MTKFIYYNYYSSKIFCKLKLIIRTDISFFSVITKYNLSNLENIKYEVYKFMFSLYSFCESYLYVGLTDGYQRSNATPLK